MTTVAYQRRRRLIRRLSPEQRLHSYRWHHGGAWGWARARDLASGRFPPDAVLDSRAITQAAAFLRHYRRARSERDRQRTAAEFPAISAALQLVHGTLGQQLAVQARLLALQPPRDVALKTGFNVETVMSFEKLFWDFRWAVPHADGWVRNLLIKVDQLPGLRTSLRSLVLVHAFYGGIVVAEEVLDVLARVSVPLDVCRLVRGDPPYLPKDWSVLRALATGLVQVTDSNVLCIMQEYVRLRPAHQSDAQAGSAAGRANALKLRGELSYARFVAPYLETELATLQEP